MRWLGSSKRKSLPASAPAPEPGGGGPIVDRGIEFSELARSTRLMLGRVVSLLKHAVKGGTDHAAAAREMDKRTERLKWAIRAARDEIERSQATAARMQREIHERVEHVSASIGERLDAISLDLAERAKRTEQVLDLIQSIANQSRILALNALLEGTRAGTLGEGVLVVAKEMRTLAEETVASSVQAARHIDLTDFQTSMNRFQGDTVRSLQKLTADVRVSMQELGQLFTQISNDLLVTETNGNVIFEFLSTNQSARRALKKNLWAQTVARDAVEVLDDELQATPRDRGRLVNRIKEQLRDQHISTDPGFDRLTAVLARGMVRIAMEPAFIGLSFRTRRGTPLIGLDIDYCNAFSEWLGVECEFLEYPWDQCPELLETGQDIGSPEADLMWTALPPNESYENMAFSDSYTYLDYVLARRTGDTRISGLKDLEDKVLGCINDPAAFATLERAGVRWAANANVPGGQVKLANLIAYTDQTRIHDCLADGAVDAFSVDKPIYHWACTSLESRWVGKIETLPGNLAQRPWHYAVGVVAHPSSHALLVKVNEFIRWFHTQPRRTEIERRWQGEVVHAHHSYRDEQGRLLGVEDIAP